MVDDVGGVSWLLYMVRATAIVLLLSFHIWTESASDTTHCFKLPPQPVITVSFV